MFEKEERLEQLKKEIKDLDLDDMNKLLISYCNTSEKTLNMVFILESMIKKFAVDTNIAKDDISRNYKNTVYSMIDLLEHKSKLSFNDIFGMIPYLYNSYIITKSDSPIVMSFKPKLINFMRGYGPIKSPSFKSHELYNIMYKKLVKK